MSFAPSADPRDLHADRSSLSCGDGVNPVRYRATTEAGRTPTALQPVLVAQTQGAADNVWDGPEIEPDRHGSESGLTSALSPGLSHFAHRL